MSIEAPLPFTEFVFKGTSRCDLQARFENGRFVGGCDYVPEGEAAASNIHGCYEYADDAWREQPKWMSQEVTKQGARRIGDHALGHSLEHVRVIGHGGELIMASAAWLDEFSTTIRTGIHEASPDTQLHFSVTTNGLSLTEDKIGVLKRHGFTVALSLDGDRVANDRHRRDRQGNSTYDRVVRAATMLRESGIGWRILSVIDPRNDPCEALDSLASHKPGSITLLLPHANHSVRPQFDPAVYGEWLNAAYDWYLKQSKEDFIVMPDSQSLMMLMLGGVSLREAVGGRISQELFILPNGYYQRVDTIKSTEPGAVATGMDVFRHSIDEVAIRDHGIRARRLGKSALSAECRSCPLLEPCGGGHYPHRFEAGVRKLRSDAPVDEFVRAFQHPTAYCETQKIHIRHVAARVEEALNAPPGTLLKPVRKQPVVHASVGEYDITSPEAGDELAMTQVHARSFQEGYRGVYPLVTPEKLTSFVNDATPGKGFYDRQITHWGSLTGNRQPNPELQQYVYVARERSTGQIVGLAAGSVPHEKRWTYEPPMKAPNDRIDALYVDPAHQRRGVGSALLGAVMKHLSPIVVLETTENTAAVALYEKHGFEQHPMWAVSAPLFPRLKGIYLPPMAMSCGSNPHWVSPFSQESLAGLST